MFRGIDWPCSSSVWARMVRSLFISVQPASSTTHRKHFIYYKVSESRLSHCCFTSYLKYLAESLEFSRCSKEKAMAPHSSTLAWKIPWTEEPGRLQSMGSLRVRHDWATSLSLFTFMHWRRKWQPTPVFLPGESQGQQSLVGCSLWSRTEWDRTEAT